MYVPVHHQNIDLLSLPYFFILIECLVKRELLKYQTKSVSSAEKRGIMSANNIISLADAQQLVERIARGYGWISQRARDASDEEALEAIKMLQKSLGIAVTT